MRNICFYVFPLHLLASTYLTHFDIMCVVDYYYFTGHLGLGHSRAYGRQHPSRRIPSGPLNSMNLRCLLWKEFIISWWRYPCDR